MRVKLQITVFLHILLGLATNVAGGSLFVRDLRGMLRIDRDPFVTIFSLRSSPLIHLILLPWLLDFNITCNDLLK